MHRFYLPPAQCQNSSLSLSGREAHHALHVLRLRRGESVVVLDGVGNEYLSQVQELGREIVGLSVVQKNFCPARPYQITLLQALPKGRLFETIIQKATELGAARIVPVLSERVATQLDEETAAGKVERWQLTAIEAIKQCGSAWLPEVAPPTTPKAFLARAEKFDLPLIASLQADRRHPRQYFKSFVRERHHLPQSVCAWVGPEGDFTPAELSAFKSAGVLPITLGQLVLRCETAAVYCLAVLNYELQSDSR